MHGKRGQVFYHTYWVSGRGWFPLDMLRYDQSFPVDADDAFNIHQILGADWANIPESADHRSVKLGHLGDRQFWKPTIERWRSFGWTVHNLEDAV